MPQKTTGRKSIPRALRTYFKMISRIAPDLAARQGFYLFCRPFAMQKPSERELGVNAKGSERVIRSGSGDVTVYCWRGDEPDSRRNVYMVHGWASCGSKLNAWAEPLFEAGFNVHIFDLPAHGKSEGKTTNITEMAGAIRQAVQEFGPAHALISHSFGGLTACTALGEASESQIGPPFEIKRLLMVAPVPSLHELFSWWAQEMGLTEKSQRSMHELGRGVSCYPWEEYDIPTLLPDYPLPKLIIHDRDDHEIPFAEGKELAETLPDTTFVETTKLGHRRIMRDPEVIAKGVEFLLADEPATAEATDAPEPADGGSSAN